MFTYHFDIADFLPKLSDVLTLITVILTFITIREVKKQRETTYIPDLFVAERYVDFYRYKVKDKYSFFEFVPLSNESIITADDKKSIHLHLKLHNIGYGGAKYVKYNWEFDPKKIYDLVESKCDQALYKMEFEPNDKTASITHKKNGHYDCEFWEIHKEFEIDVVVPDKGDKVSKITVPNYYTTLLIYYLLFKAQDTKGDNKINIYEELSEFPELELTMKYSDIMNKEYSKTFTVKVNAMANHHKKNDIQDQQPIGTLIVKVKEIVKK